MVLRLPIEESSRCDTESRETQFDIALVQSHQPPSFLKRERSEQDAVHNTKNGRVRPNPQSQRQHSHDGEAGVLQQLADGEFQVVHKLVGADVTGPWTMTKSE